MSRKVPSVSAANYASIFTAPVFSDQNGEWYRKVGYADSLDLVRENFLNAGKSFVAIGYYLKHIREKELYREGGYSNIWECARMEFGLSDTAASNYMKMNDAYSVNGDTPILDDKYGGFNKSQLQEMLALTAGKREEIVPEQTVGEIREIAKEEKKGKEPAEKEIRWFYDGYVKDMDSGPRDTLKERLKEKYRHTNVVCPDGRSWSGTARGIRINRADEVTWAQLVKLVNLYIPQDEPKGREAAVPDGEESQIPGQMEIEDYPEVMPGRVRAEETEDYPEAMPGRTEETQDSVVSQTGKEDSGAGGNRQPEAPMLKNDSERKEWLEKYREWGLWYRDEHIDVNYYKYDFPDGSRLIVAEYPKRQSYWNVKAQDEHHFHLLEKGRQGYEGVKYDGKYRNAPDSETYLLEFLRKCKKHAI